MSRACTQDKNKSMCTCSYEPCSRKGLCCACIQYHQRSGEIPGCLFPPDAERTYDRSREAFLRAWRG